MPFDLVAAFIVGIFGVCVYSMAAGLIRDFNEQ
jgi:hypothetical protein